MSVAVHRPEESMVRANAIASRSSFVVSHVFQHHVHGQHLDDR